jgi:DNA-binding ferritin-like protein (Dps family)
MSNPTLRETLMRNSISNVRSTNPKEKDKIFIEVDQILQAVSEYIEELIGEDDEEYGDKWESGMNQLRQDLREKLKEDLG